MYNQGFLYPQISRTSLLGSLSKINFSTVLNNTQKVLNIANQTIPLINQVKPMVNNARTVLKVFGAINKNTDNNIAKVSKNLEEINNSKNENFNNGPVFYL